MKCVILCRTIHDRDTWTDSRIDECIHIISNAAHQAHCLYWFPFVLNVKPEPIFATELIEEVGGQGVMPLVNPIGEPVCSPKLDAMLGLDVIRVALQAQR